MVKKYFQLLKQTVSEWSDDKAPRLGAALAFYSILSLGPLLLLVLAAAGLFFDHDVAQGKILSQLKGMIGDNGAHAIQDMLTNSAQNKDKGIIASILGVITLLFGASGVFGELQDAMNTIWNVKPAPGRGIWGFIRTRFLSLTMVLGTAFLLLTSLLISTGITVFTDYTSGALSDFSILIQGVNFFISFMIISFLFAVIFKYLPDAKIDWHDVWIGAVITAFLFTIGKYGISLYLGHSSFTSSYGAAGSLVVVLVWVYYSAQILFFGAEFTQVHANRFGKRVEPKPHAVLDDKK